MLMQQIDLKFLNNGYSSTAECAVVNVPKTIDQKINQEDKEWATDMVVSTLATGMAKKHKHFIQVHWVESHTTLAVSQYSIQWISALLQKFFGVAWDSWIAMRCSHLTWGRLAA
jgi:hypothetical protein